MGYGVVMSKRSYRLMSAEDRTTQGHPYRACTAHTLATVRTRQPRRRRKLWNPRLWQYVQTHLTQGCLRFPPLFGQVFSDNKLVNLGLVSSFRTGFFSRCCFPQKATGRRGCDFQPCACSQRRTRIGYTGRSFVGPYPKVAPPVYPKCTSAGVCRPRLWCRRTVL
jgi:hypothetical protein